LKGVNLENNRQIDVPYNLEIKGSMPTFIIGGAMKAGTTTLWAWVSAHPEIGMANGKEPRFFTREQSIADGGGPDAPPRSGRFDRGFRWYASLFDTCASKRVRGEASSRYLHAPDSAELIHGALPEVKLIFVLRDPAERMYAHYRHELRFLTGLPDFRDLVKERHPRYQRYLADSSYATLLQRYFQRFHKEQIHIVLTEDLRNNPSATVAGIFEFLDVDDTFRPDNLKEIHNPSAKSASPLLNRLLTLNSYSQLKAFLPSSVGQLGGRIKRRIIDLNKLKERVQPMDGETRADLINILSGELDQLETMLSIELSSWRQPNAPDR
jgi:hypothetical protein